MSIYIVEYDPAISGEAHKVIEDNVKAEMFNEETALYEIVNCIEALQNYEHLKSDLDFLNEIASNSTHPISYIEF